MSKEVDTSYAAHPDVIRRSCVVWDRRTKFASGANITYTQKV